MKKIRLNSAPFHNDQWAGYRCHRKEAKKKWFWYIKLRGENKASGIDKKDRKKKHQKQNQNRVCIQRIDPSKQTSGLVVIPGCFPQAKSFLATRSALLPSLSCFSQRTPLLERIPSPPNLPCFPVFLSKPLPALMCTIPPMRHPHPAPWASRALGHLSMQLLITKQILT